MLTIIRWAEADNITLGQGPTRIVKDDTKNSKNIPYSLVEELVIYCQWLVLGQRADESANLIGLGCLRMT